MSNRRPEKSVTIFLLLLAGATLFTLWSGGNLTIANTFGTLAVMGMLIASTQKYKVMR